ncbi:MAG: hypothetical protein Q7J42_18040 [Sulfuritalea sp.]|nr:hypothetical protein [Sulfuritalea sp.]
MLQSYEAIYDHGQVKWIGEGPAVEQARVIVTVLSGTIASASRTARRQPSPKIKGTRIVGDIMSSAVPDSDWDALK